VAVLLVAAAFRFHGLDWDQRIGAHPDERYIVDVASRLSFPERLDPFAAGSDVAYGHLPLYLLTAASALAPRVDPLLVGRALSAAFDVGTVALTFALGRRVYDAGVGLLAAAFVALTVAHVQEAHFATVDGTLAFFVVGALLFAVRLAEEGRPVDGGLAGVWAGLAVGTKVTAGLLVVPLGVACSYASTDKERRRAVVACGLGAGLAFLITNPFTVVEPGRFLSNVARQGAIVRGILDVPYTRQYRGTVPYVYPLVQQLRWGMGWLPGAFAMAGLALEAVRAVRESLRPGRWVLLAWAVSFFAFVGGLYVKFPRYLLPLLPVLVLYAAGLVVRLARWRRLLLPMVLGVLLGVLLLRCVALSAMYRKPHPWLQASEWFYDHVEQGATVAVEAWDHPLPLEAGSHGYVLRELPIFEVETTGTGEVLRGVLDEADYVVVASRRCYATLARWPVRYASGLDYYERLFTGAAGLELAGCFSRYPHVGAVRLTDDPTAELAFSLPKACRPDGAGVVRLGKLDESFVVYDHPQVMIFEVVR
jgi:hypothetical protein